MKTKNNFYNVKSSGIGKASIKDVDMSKRIVTGLYNCYNFMDSGMDVLLDGSCKNTIKERGPKSNAVAKIKHALFHDITRLPGKILVLDERTVEVEGVGKVSGPYFETQMDKSTEGNDTLIKYQEGVYDNHSIGYSIVDLEKIERDGQHGNSQKWQKYMDLLINPEKAEAAGYFYALKELTLWEGSTVGFGMNVLTPYLGVKGKEEVTEIQLMERFEKLQKLLKIGALSDESLESAEIQMLQLKQIMSDLFSKYQLKSDREKQLSKLTCSNPDCTMSGQEVDCAEGDTCDKCGSAMKSYESIYGPDTKAAPPAASFYKQFSEELLK